MEFNNKICLEEHHPKANIEDTASRIWPIFYPRYCVVKCLVYRVSLLVRLFLNFVKWLWTYNINTNGLLKRTKHLSKANGSVWNLLDRAMILKLLIILLMIKGVHLERLKECRVRWMRGGVSRHRKHPHTLYWWIEQNKIIFIIITIIIFTIIAVVIIIDCLTA